MLAKEKQILSSSFVNFLDHALTKALREVFQTNTLKFQDVLLPINSLQDQNQCISLIVIFCIIILGPSQSPFWILKQYPTFSTWGTNQTLRVPIWHSCLGDKNWSRHCFSICLIASRKNNAASSTVAGSKVTPTSPIAWWLQQHECSLCSPAMLLYTHEHINEQLLMLSHRFAIPYYWQCRLLRWIESILVVLIVFYTCIDDWEASYPLAGHPQLVDIVDLHFCLRPH